MKIFLRMVGTVLLAALFTQGSCEFQHEIEQLDDFNKLFEEFIDTVNKESDGWQELADLYAGLLDENSEEWQEKVDAFNGTIQDFIETINMMYDQLDEKAQEVFDELQVVLNETITLTNGNFICASEIVSHKLVEVLNVIEFNYNLATINYDPSIDLNAPIFCPPSVVSIDLTKPDNQWNLILVAGYNLPETSVLDIILKGDNGVINDEVLFEVGTFNYQGPFLLAVNLAACTSCTKSILRHYNQLVIGVYTSEVFKPMIELPIIN